VLILLCTRACVGCPFNLYNPHSQTPITVVESILEPLGHRRTWPSTKATLNPRYSKAEIEIRFFFEPCTRNTSFIEIDLLESSWQEFFLLLLLHAWNHLQVPPEGMNSFLSNL
jgi:hypothetical protein